MKLRLRLNESVPCFPQPKRAPQDAFSMCGVMIGTDAQRAVGCMVSSYNLRRGELGYF
ncbi:MAG TPA: hypothetical protein VLX44_18480 [Xanthobacteraceae bacterium]|nr:hypothetical protein [Xanthobacteraceae bacterium]